MGRRPTSDKQDYVNQRGADPTVDRTRVVITSKVGPGRVDLLQGAEHRKRLAAAGPYLAAEVRPAPAQCDDVPLGSRSVPSVAAPDSSITASANGRRRSMDASARARSA